MILIVDDKKENLFSLKRLLELHAFEVDTASSGEEALKKILKNFYALIILDVQMPGMDGYEVAEAITGYSKSKHVPIIFLSAVNIDKRFITKGYASGGIDYIIKPFDPEILLMKVKTFQKLYEQTNELTRIQGELQEEIETRKQAEQQIQQNLNQLTSILEALPLIAFTMTADGELEFVNEHWFRYSLRKQEFPGTENGHPKIRELVLGAIRSGIPTRAEVSIIQLATREYRHHMLRFIPVVQDKQIVQWIGTLSDIHEQRVANQVLEQKVSERTSELRDTNKALEERNDELEQYAFLASHDLQEPLRKIETFSKLISERYLLEQPDARQYVTRMIKSSVRMRTLINDLLSYSKLSAESLFETADLTQLMREVEVDLELSIREKEVELSIGTLPVAEVIPGQIRNLFQNLLSNSIKFSRTDVLPVITISSEFINEPLFDAPVCPTGDYCRIFFADNGIGFDEVYIDKVFTIFQRLNSREEYQGTGIGLAIVKKIVDKHHGLITAKSIENCGTTFILVLPLKQQAPITLTTQN